MDSWSRSGDGVASARPTTLERLRNAALVLFALFACWQAYRAYRSYAFEDAYITFRYAQNLAQGQGFVFNPGERVLGTTTPLFALLLAGLARLGLDVAASGHLLSILCLAGTALAGAWILRSHGHADLGVLYALLVLAGSFGVYALTGMETSLMSLLLLAAWIAAQLDRPVLLGVLIGLAGLTRYDAVVFAAPLFLILWKRAGKLPWKSVLVAGALLAPWLWFSSVYFGSFLPNTYHAKQGLSSGFFSYLAESLGVLGGAQLFAFGVGANGAPLPAMWAALAALAALALLAPIALVLRGWLAREPLLVLLLVYPLALYGGYAFIGGPPRHWWHVVSGALILLLAALLAWGDALERLGAARLWTTWLSLLGLATGFALLPALLGRQVAGATEQDEYRSRAQAYEELAHWFVAHGLSDLRVMLLEPGYFAYLSGCPVVDLGGLVTKGLKHTGERESPEAMQALIERHEPDAIVGRWPGFEPVLSFPRDVCLRPEVFRERLDALLRPTPADPALELHHPLDFGLERERIPGWVGAERFAGAGGPAGGSPRVLTTDPALTGTSECTLVSPPFALDFDELSFRFACVNAAGPSLRVELAVDGRVVLSVDGRAGAQGAWLEVRWPVNSWRGRAARLLFTDGANEGWLVADGFRSLRRAHAEVFDDFEGAAYGARWGTTFGDAPTPAREVAERLGLAFVLGRSSALSLGRTGPQALLSAPFVIEHEGLSFVAFSTGDANARVELRVDGQALRTFACRRSRALQGVVWDLTPLRGRTASLAILDDDPAPEVGIGVDDIVLFDDER